MRSFLLLLLFVSCAFQNKSSDTSPTESDAKLVSPYSVKPCFCMKIYQPVCASDVTYGNSCEAECYGHTNWTQGPCSTTKLKTKTN